MIDVIEIFLVGQSFLVTIDIDELFQQAAALGSYQFRGQLQTAGSTY